MGKVLIVDDEEGIRLLYQQVVSEMGHEVFAARDAGEAKAFIDSVGDLDVALVDRVLPGEEDGLDILRHIQTSQPLCQTILVSGYPTFSSASQALRYCAFEYLAKPVQTAELCRAVDAALGEKRARQERLLDAEKSKKNYAELKSKQELLQHDMRSMLIGIIGFANLLINRTTLDRVQLEYCKQIQQCGIQLENMINTYLDISNLEQLSFELEKREFDLLDVIRQSRQALHFLADEKNLNIHIIYNKRLLSIDDSLPVRGNRMYLQNAINNLVKNAIEASPADRSVKIKIRDAEESLALLVHNWGAVPPEIRPSFFGKYVTSGKKRGLGLGTYMAKLVVNAHGGEIGFRSSEDEGTEVSISLPRGATGV